MACLQQQLLCPYVRQMGRCILCCAKKFRNLLLEKNNTLSTLNHPLICPFGETLTVSIRNPTIEGFPFPKKVQC